MGIRKKDDVDWKELEKLGFKYGTRDRFIYKTKKNGFESSIYIELTPCHNNNNEIKVNLTSRYIPDKIMNVLFDLINFGYVEKF